MHQAEMRRCLIECDVAAIRRLWMHVAPHLPVPHTDMECLISIHMARTQCPIIKESLRFYSHRWLTDQGFPSQLPDRLKPKAERMYPRIVRGVGVACATHNPIMKEVLPYIQGAMQDVVMNSSEAVIRDRPLELRAWMQEARAATTKKLVGIIVPTLERAKHFGLKK